MTTIIESIRGDKGPELPEVPESPVIVNISAKKPEESYIKTNKIKVSLAKDVKAEDNILPKVESGVSAKMSPQEPNKKATVEAAAPRRFHLEMPARSFSSKSPRNIHIHNIPKSARADEIDNIINALYNDTMDSASWINCRAVMWKTGYIVSVIFILILSITASVLSFTTGTSATPTNQTFIADNIIKNRILYAIGVITICITALKTAVFTFNIPKRAQDLKISSAKLRTIARNAKLLRNRGLARDDLLKQLDELYLDAETIEINLSSGGPADITAMAARDGF